MKSHILSVLHLKIPIFLLALQCLSCTSSTQLEFIFCSLMKLINEKFQANYIMVKGQVL